MEIVKTEVNGEVTLALNGCLDTTATPEFAKAIEGTLGATSLVLEMSKLEFISSSALRTLVATKKQRGVAFEIVLVGMNEVVREVFDVTGLDEVFCVR